MDHTNPYAPPSEPADEVMFDDYLAVDGPFLVVGRRAVLPMRCVKTNQPAESSDVTQSRLEWAPSFQLVLRKHICEIRYCVSSQYRRRKRVRNIAVGLLLGIAFAAFLVRFGLLSLMSFFIFSLLIIYRMRAPNDLVVHHTANGLFWLKGCCPEFLTQCEHETTDRSIV